jgi:S1-C subfamily serine protease
VCGPRPSDPFYKYHVPQCLSRFVSSLRPALGIAVGRWKGPVTPDLGGTAHHTPGDGRKRKVRRAKGVVVRHVYADGAAESSGLEEGDVIRTWCFGNSHFLFFLCPRAHFFKY